MLVFPRPDEFNQNYLLTANATELAEAAKEAKRITGEEARIMQYQQAVMFIFKTELAAYRMGFHLGKTTGVFVEHITVVGDWAVSFAPF